MLNRFDWCPKPLGPITQYVAGFHICEIGEREWR